MGIEGLAFLEHASWQVWLYPGGHAAGYGATAGCSRWQYAQPSLEHGMMQHVRQQGRLSLEHGMMQHVQQSLLLPCNGKISGAVSVFAGKFSGSVLILPD